MDRNHLGLCIGLREGKEVFYQTAADVIERLHAELEKHRWIPVEERLPVDQTMYLVSGGLHVWQHLWKGRDRCWRRGQIDGRPMCRRDNITHWKPIILP